MQPTNSRPSFLLIGAVLAGLVVLWFLAQSNAPTNVPRPPPSPTEIPRFGTINARNGTVDMWNDYTTRTAAVAKLHGGDRVRIIRRSGTGVLVETDAGQTGWVSSGFIDE